MNSNCSYSPETAKLGVDLCDLDLWPLTLTFCMDITSVIDNNSWKWYDDMMLGTSQKGVTDTDRQTDWTIHWAAWSQLPPRVLLLCRSWGACVPRRSQRLCQLEFWLLVGTTMLDRLWARGQTKCNTPLMLATSVFGRIHRRPCYVMAQLKSRLNIPWPNDAECMGHVWCHLLCWYPLFCDVESLAGYVRG